MIGPEGVAAAGVGAALGVGAAPGVGVGASAAGSVEGSEPDGGVALEEGPLFGPAACGPVACRPVAGGSCDDDSAVFDAAAVVGEAGARELVVSGAGSEPLSIRQPISSELSRLAPTNEVACRRR